MTDHHPPLRALVNDPNGIQDSDTLLRVVPPAFFEGREVQSRAFQDQTAEVAAKHGLGGPCASVNVRRIWEGESGDIADLLKDFDEGSGILEFSVADARALKTLGPTPSDVPQGVMLDPRDGRPWHAVVFPLAGGKRNKASMVALRECAVWFWHPDDAKAEDGAAAPPAGPAPA